MLYVNKRAVAAAFGRAAETYSYHDALQRNSAKYLKMLLGANNFTIVLDAGCGPGNNSYISHVSKNKVVAALDLSLEMVIQARKRKIADVYLVADIEALSFRDASFDLVWSHLAVQWCTNLKQALSELYRVARPGGVVAFTTVLGLSLSELRQAWLAVDMHPHTNSFLSVKEVKAILAPWRYRFAVQKITLTFNNALAAMQSLKGVGATHLHNKRSQKTLTRSELQRIELAWPQKQGQFPLTYQLFHGILERD